MLRCRCPKSCSVHCHRYLLRRHIDLHRGQTRITLMLHTTSLVRTLFGAVPLAAALLTFAAGPAVGQSAYFSLTGEFGSLGSLHDFYFDLSRTVGSAEVLRSQTLTSSGGTNAAGDILDPLEFDSVLELFDSGGASLGSNDDGFFGGRDSLLSWGRAWRILAARSPAILGCQPKATG